MNPIAENADRSVVDTAQASSLEFRLKAPAAAPVPASVWELSALLQTTLDVEKVIELFATELGKRIPVDSFMYQHSDRDLSFSLGDAPARHSTHYRLLLEERLLGEITVTRAVPFTDVEISAIENLISGLMYGLRNALLYQEALESALRDPLTGVANRTALETALKREMSLSQRHKLPLSVLMLDIDKFKLINDHHGHVVGDLILKALTDGALACIRGSDVLARYGGEEFVVVLPGTDRNGALLLGARIRRHIENLKCLVPGVDKAALRFTISIGVTAFDGQQDYASIVDRADQAMYTAKQLGGNQVAVI